MIDWKSIKKAADPVWPGFRKIQPETMRDPRSEQRMFQFYADRIAPPIENSNPIPRTRSYNPFNALWNPVANMGYNRARKNDPGIWHMLPYEKNPVPFGVSYQLPDGKFTTTVQRRYIRPMLYGWNNREREQRETQAAYEARWKRLFDLAPDEASRQNLEARRAAGQIPPIIPRGVYGYKEGDGPVWLMDGYFGHPYEAIQATFDPGGGRSASYTFGRRLYAGGADNVITGNSREEFMHQAALTPKGRGTLVDGLLGGDDYNNALNKGQNPVGAYELDPAEMMRMVGLQKAAAARLNLPPMKDPNDWIKFVQLQNYMTAKGITPFRKDSLDYPFDQNNPNRLDASTRGDSIIKLILDLQRLQGEAKAKGDTNGYNLRTRQLQQLWDVMQDAIDMASYGQRNDDVMNA